MRKLLRHSGRRRVGAPRRRGHGEYLRLHIGCGGVAIPGFVNIDMRRTSATDIVCSAGELPFPSRSAEAIESFHMIEHLPHPAVPGVLEEWFRVLRPGARLVIECPDFDETIREYLAGNERRIYNVYGLQRFDGDAHLFGYNFERLKAVLEAAGFTHVRRAEPTDYHASEEPCMRVESVRKVAYPPQTKP